MRRLSLSLLCLAAGAACAQTDPSVKVNGIGFLPDAHKLAVVPAGVPTSAGARFEVVEDAGGKPVLAGALAAPQRWDPSGETVRIADFSALRKPGRYRIKAEGAPPSAPFTVGADSYRALGTAALKAFYFNRTALALAPKHAGAWARPAGHPDERVLVHASAASSARPAGTVIASSKGWYDAGDYNKYIPSSAISTYTLLAAYEHFPRWFDALEANIPESGNGVPDVVDEAMWNLEWMLSMQDPADGGVYHKLTNLTFDAMVMPHQAMKAPRYVVAKSTSAALNFAATMAVASRVLAPYQKQYPGMAARMLAAAERAWEWAAAHPALLFKNPPDVVTGEYGDARVDDERAWAAAELYISTGKDGYYTALQPETVSNTYPAWDDVRGLAWVSLAHHRARLTPLADRGLIAARVDGLAARLAQEWKSSGYRVPMRGADFVWGSNAVMLNQALMLVQGHRLNGKPEYLAAAQSALDYVLGRNAFGRSFVTGFGVHPPLHPHHRPSQGDTVAAPVPGWVVGGPQPFQQDKAECPPYPSALPALSWLDHVCSYASNEVAINWNAPLVYLTAALSELTPQANAMTHTTTPLDAVRRQEQLLQFDSFSNKAALDIGLELVERARARKAVVSVEIARNGQTLFAHGMDGAPPDHAHWIRRKSNLVNRTGHSSYYTHLEVVQNGGDYEAIPTFDAREYAAHGGAFPVVVKGTGQVGTITVSGLPGPEDHALVVGVLKDYLAIKGEL
ncbi:heme-degrading domain-containing protein [Massilia sp. Leaf139]|uniref:heme-degrading domain-containing protein n=1 Tax=Massilia sp. Leaf139 TaxID=1736272 RepID=UPI0006FCD909|nr:heme-degrading domain-containing protein [Massilia sp. Leaf139]KQQ97022.1 cellulase [Massilia sp. Leaf139]